MYKQTASKKQYRKYDTTTVTQKVAGDWDTEAVSSQNKNDHERVLTDLDMMFCEQQS